MISSEYKKYSSSTHFIIFSINIGNLALTLGFIIAFAIAFVKTNYLLSNIYLIFAFMFWLFNDYIDYLMII